MKAPCCFKLLIFISVSECLSFKNKKGSTQELALDEDFMKIDLPGITIAFSLIRFKSMGFQATLTPEQNIQTVLFQNKWPIQKQIFQSTIHL